MHFLRIFFCVITMVSVASSTETASLPCKVPVFRYALEHWLPDSYEVVILHRGSLSVDEEALVTRMEAKVADPDGFVNLRVLTINLDEDGEFEVLTQALGPDFKNKIDSPEMVLLYPANSDSGPLAWRGPLTSENVDSLFDSPARKQITEWVLQGESVVWVLMGVGDPEKDNAAKHLFLSEIPRLEKEIELRDVEVIELEKKYNKDAKVKLRLGIKLLVIDRNDPKEKIFAATLARSEKDLEELGEPFAIPVFGRGRAYLSLAGKGINPDMIERTCRFLIGDCSCEIKRLNPGVDLLFAVNWDEYVGGIATQAEPRPLLTGNDIYIDVPAGKNKTIEDIADVSPLAMANDGMPAKTTSYPLTVWIAGLVVLGIVVFGFAARLLL